MKKILTATALMLSTASFATFAVGLGTDTTYQGGSSESLKQAMTEFVYTKSAPTVVPTFITTLTPQPNYAPNAVLADTVFTVPSDKNVLILESHMDGKNSGKLAATFSTNNSYPDGIKTSASSAGGTDMHILLLQGSAGEPDDGATTVTYTVNMYAS